MIYVAVISQVWLMCRSALNEEFPNEGRHCVVRAALIYVEFSPFFITIFGVESQRLSTFYGVCQRLSNSWVELFRIPIWCEVERRNLHLDGSSYLQLLP